MGIKNPPPVMKKNAADQAVPSVGANSIGDGSTLLYGDGTNIVNIPTAGTADVISIPVRKDTAGTIAELKPLHIVSWNASGYYNVEEADANSAATMPAVFLSSTAVSNVATGTGVISGNIKNVDTSAWNTDDPLYVANGGGLTTTKPTGDDLIQKVGIVGRDNVATGSVLVIGAGRTNDIPNDLNIINSLTLRNYAGDPNGAVTAATGSLIYDSTGDNLYANTDDGTTWKLINDGTGSVTSVAGGTGLTSTGGTTPSVSHDSHTGDVSGSTALTIGAKKVTLGMMEDGTDGELITYSAAGVAAKVAVGTDGQLLQSNGAGTAPTFETIAAAVAGIEVLGEASGTIAGQGAGTYLNLGNFSTGGDIGNKLLIVEIMSYHDDDSSVDQELKLSNASASDGIGGSWTNAGIRSTFRLYKWANTATQVIYEVNYGVKNSFITRDPSKFDLSASEVIHISARFSDTDNFSYYWKAYLINNA